MAIPALLIAAVFAYGYWYTVTHALFDVEVEDSSGLRVSDSDTEITFLDDSGRVLAQSVTEDQTPGLLFISQPAAYSCREIERQAMFRIGGQEEYGKCFERQSRWMAGWVRDARHVDVRIGTCRWTRVPLVVNREPTGPSDWWLLWLSPHAGGSPYTPFNATVTVDTGRC